MRVRARMRRAAASLIALFVFIPVVAGRAPWSTLPEVALPVSAQEAMPIIDLHFHPASGWDQGTLVTLFDQLGVAKAGNGPGGPDTLALAFAKRYPERFIPFAGLWEITDIVQRDKESAWNLTSGQMTSYLGRLEQGLASGVYKGIGELYPNNLNTHPSNFPGQRYPADSPLMRRLWALSAKYGVPLSVHLEAQQRSIEEMERLLETTPPGTFIWAHTGFYAEPALLSRLLTQHSDLYCELSWRDERFGNLSIPNFEGADTYASLERPSRRISR